MCIYIYIYIERERQRERERVTRAYQYIYTLSKSRLANFPWDALEVERLEVDGLPVGLLSL